MSRNRPRWGLGGAVGRRLSDAELEEFGKSRRGVIAAAVGGAGVSGASYAVGRNHGQRAGRRRGIAEGRQWQATLEDPAKRRVMREGLERTMPPAAARRAVSEERKRRTAGVLVDRDVFGRHKVSVGKADRRYDPESKRQRRLGGAISLTAAGGALLGAKGVRGIRNTTRTIRGLGNLPNLSKEKTQLLRSLQEGRSVAASRRDLGRVGGGAGLLVASGGMSSYASGRRNRRWE